MSEAFQLEGLIDCERAMMEMSKAITTRLAETALMNAAEPLVDAAQDLAPRHTGGLERGIDVSKKLSRRQKSLNVKQSDVEVYVGPAPSAKAIQQEFGNEKQAAQPYMRPAWDANKTDVMFNVRDELAVQIDKAAKRAAKRQAKLIAQAQSGR